MGDPHRRQSLSEQLRVAVRESGRSLNLLAEATGVDVASLSRFMRGQSTLRLDATDRLAEHLGLSLRKTSLPTKEAPMTATLPLTPLGRFVAAWNARRPDLALAPPNERATHLNVLKVADGEWFQILFRHGADARPRLEVGMAFDTMDEGQNEQARRSFATRLAGSGVSLKERGKLVKYLTTTVGVSGENDPDPFGRAADVMSRLIDAWRASGAREG